MMRLVALILSISLAACESKQVKESLDSIGDQLKRLEPAKESVETATKAEVEKLWIHEYKVEEIPVTMDSTQIEEQLMTLGKDRWDCFHLEKKEEVLQIFCKRRPQSYLRYIPRWLP